MNHSPKDQIEMVNQQIKELMGIYQEAISCFNISGNELWVWYALIIMDGEYSQKDICSMWFLPKQTVNTIITHMVQKGLASLEVVPGTKNRKTIRLTEAGKRYGESIVVPIFNAEQRAFGKIPTEDRIAFMSALDKYITSLREEISGVTKK